MLKTHLVLMDELKNYASPAKKIERMVKSGELTRVVRGLYETDPHTPGHLLAASIYGPSYLSFEYALAHHGLIPEAVHQYTSASFDKKRAKQFETPFGVFSYRDIPEEAFPYGVQPLIENGYSYRLATPEKALCDELYKLSPCANRAELEQLLFENLRIDRQAFLGLDFTEMEQLASLYQTKNHKLLRSRIRKEIRHATDLSFVEFNPNLENAAPSQEIENLKNEAAALRAKIKDLTIKNKHLKSDLALTKQRLKDAQEQYEYLLGQYQVEVGNKIIHF